MSEHKEIKLTKEQIAALIYAGFEQTVGKSELSNYTDVEIQIHISMNQLQGGTVFFAEKS